MNYSTKFSILNRYYTLAAINFLTVILLILVLNIIVWLAIEIRDAFLSPPSRNLEVLQEVYPGMAKSDISLLLDETWKRPWQYEPWVGFKERPRSGRFVNVSDEGFRYSYIKNLRLDAHSINIWVFGGSTTFGYGVDDASTIPSHLQKHLSDLYPEKEINVFNFGRGYYYSTQEFALLVQLLGSNHIPLLAIFIDGLNEGQAAPHYSKEMSAMFDAYNYEHHKLINHFIMGNTSLMRVMRKLMSFVTPQTPQTPRKFLDPVKIYEEYLKNKKHITLLSREYNFSPYFFIQPVPGYRNNFHNHKFMSKNRPPNKQQQMNSKMQLLERTVDDQNSFSITGILENYRLQPFVDNVHYTSDVCDLIAAFIARKIQIP